MTDLRGVLEKVEHWYDEAMYVVARGLWACAVLGATTGALYLLIRFVKWCWER